MKSIPVLFVCFLMVTVTIVNACPRDTTIKAIEIRDNTMAFGETFYRIINIGPCVVYQSQYRSEGSGAHPKFDSSTNQTTLETTTLWSEFRDQFFVFHKDSSFGYQYDAHDSSNDNRRLLVDTVMKGIKGRNNYEGLLSIKPDTTTWNDTKTELREVYVGDSVKGQPHSRIVFYYSSYMNHVKESLNPALDSTKKMKFYKMEVFTDEFYSETDKKLWPPMKLLSSEMKEIIIEDAEEVKNYFNRFKKSIGQ